MENSINKKKLTKKIVISVITMVFSLLFALPFVYMVFGSLQPTNSAIILGKFFPETFQFKNYPEAIEYIDFFNLLKNTVVIVVCNLIFSVISTVLVAYGFSRFKAPGKNILFYIMLSTMMLPWVVTLVPSYVMFDRIGWTDSFLPLIIPALGSSPYYVFMLKQFLSGIPKDLDEAAKIDGASSIRILFGILLPLMLPALATMLIMTFNGLWSDYVGPSLYLASPELHTLAVGLQYFKPSSGGSMPWNVVMAACVMFSIPMIVVMFSCQKVFTNGMLVGGVKG